MYVWGLVLAQGGANDALGPNIGPWANLGAISALIGLCVWIMTKYIPDLNSSERSERVAQRSDFIKELAGQRTEFMTTLRDQRLDFVKAMNDRDARVEAAFDRGQMALSKLSDTFNVLHDDMAKIGEAVDNLENSWIAKRGAGN